MKYPNRKRLYDAIDHQGKWSWLTAERNEDGDVISVSVHSKHDDYHFSDLSETEQEKALAWMRANILPRATALESRTSYGMKHILERRTNIYMTNNQFKEAMLLCGYYPVEVDELNWCYCVSKKSPIFTRQADDLEGLLIPACVMNYSAANKETGI